MRSIAIITSVATLLGAWAVRAAEPPLDESVRPAAKLLAATVTIRVLPVDVAKREPADSGPAGGVTEGISVCSGVSLGKGLIVTFTSALANSRFRITLVDGEQAEGQLRVVDHYSGLSLLEITRRDLVGLELATDLPNVGGSILTAAAAGIERPVVSLGILGGKERAIPGTGLPPLLQCDVRTTETSSGSAVVDSAGRLVGIVVATPAPAAPGGWTYAVSLHHVERLLRARVDRELVVLERRRPSVGFTLGPGEKDGTVMVERVVPQGPAARAGIQAGDVVTEVEGRRIRSAYQAIDLVLKKQPGENLQLVVEQSGKSRAAQIVLEGDTSGSGVAAADPKAIRIGPQLTVRPLGRKQIEVRESGRVEEVAVAASAPDKRLPRDELSLLKTQLEAFEKVIVRLQSELIRRDENQVHTQELIEKLSAEIAQLRKQLPKP